MDDTDPRHDVPEFRLTDERDHELPVIHVGEVLFLVMTAILFGVAWVFSFFDTRDPEDIAAEDDPHGGGAQHQYPRAA